MWWYCCSLIKNKNNKPDVVITTRWGFWLNKYFSEVYQFDLKSLMSSSSLPSGPPTMSPSPAWHFEIVLFRNSMVRSLCQRPAGLDISIGGRRPSSYKVSWDRMDTRPVHCCSQLVLAWPGLECHKKDLVQWVLAEALVELLVPTKISKCEATEFSECWQIWN